MMKIITIWILLGLIFISCNDQITTVALETINDLKLTLKHPNGKQVGEELWVLLSSDVKKNIPMTLVMTSGISVRIYKVMTQKKLVIPGSHLRESGRYSLAVIYGDNLRAEMDFHLIADSISNPLDLYSGPTSILVGGKQTSMITTIPADQYDNGIVTDTKISISTDRTERDNKQVSIKNLLAVYELTSDEKSKIVTAGVSQNNKSSKAQTIIQEADWAQDFKIELKDQYPYADNTHYTKIRTNKLEDEYGNQIANGTLVVFNITSDHQSKSKYNSIVIDGYASVNIRNPKEPSTLLISAHIGPYSTSNNIELTYSSIIKRIPFKLDSKTNILKIGPIVAHEGQFIPDGTLARLRTEREETEIEVIDGECQFDLSKLGLEGAQTYFLNIGGLEQKIVIK